MLKVPGDRPLRIVVIAIRTAAVVPVSCQGWLGSLVGTCRAEDLQTFTLALKGRRFIPAELHVPAGKPFFLIVSNQEGATDELEMGSPSLEKVTIRDNGLVLSCQIFVEQFSETITRNNRITASFLLRHRPGSRQRSRKRAASSGMNAAPGFSFPEAISRSRI
jgi:hypothetical protein